MNVTLPAGRVKGEIVPGGLYDLKMGTLNAKEQCETCHATYKGVEGVADCPGHFGVIEVCQLELFSAECYVNISHI